MSLLKNLTKLWTRPSPQAIPAGTPALRSEGTGGDAGATGGAESYFIKPGYQSRPKPDYFHDVLAEKNAVVHQPDVYPFAGYLARRWGCTHIVDVGCGSALKLVSLHPEFQLIGVDYGDNLGLCAKRYPFGTWIKHDLDRPGKIPISPDILSRSVVVCADVIEHMVHPEFLLQRMKLLMEHAPVGLLSTPDRELLRGPADMGPPLNAHHVREWSLDELEQLLRTHELNVGFMGWTMNNNRKWEKKTILSVIERSGEGVSVRIDRRGRLSYDQKDQKEMPDDATNLPESFLHEPGGSRPARTTQENSFPLPRREGAGGGSYNSVDAPPPSFHAVAIIVAFNEEDIIVPTIQQLHAQGIDTYLVDNWSTDQTHALAGELLGQGLIGIEQFPADGPTDTYDWKRLLTRVEEVSLELKADWFIHYDADEVRRSPWPDVDLREGLWRVDQEGFNAVDHTMMDFSPIDDSYAPGTDLEAHYKYFRFGMRRGHFVRVQAWKNMGRRVDLANSGGHDVQFDGRKVYPYKFLLKHYPIRSQAHGERKVLRERKARWNAEEKQGGWHHHYDQITEETRFIEDPATLLLFEETQFNREFLVERLSGVGIVRETPAMAKPKE